MDYTRRNCRESAQSQFGEDLCNLQQPETLTEAPILPELRASIQAARGRSEIKTNLDVTLDGYYLIVSDFAT